MKHIKLTLTVILLLLVLIGCRPSGTIEIQKPENVVINQRLVTWNAVSDATGYQVEVNGNQVNDVTVNNYSIPNQLIGVVSIRVRTVKGEKTSEYSEAVSTTLYLTLSSPSNVRRDGNLIRWDSVTQATGYIIKINDVEYTTAMTQYAITVNQVLNIQVKALGSQAAFINDSPFSSVLVLNPDNQTVDSLLTPQNVRIVNQILYFDAVANATSYEIFVNDELYTTINTTSYTIPSALLNAIGSFLQVRATASGFITSNFSQKIFLGTVSIATEAELRAITSSGAYTLANHITLTSPWIPIDFNGILDGNGYSILGIEINSNERQVGFFKSLHGANIQNLSLQGSLTSNNSQNAPRIGGLAGFVTESLITNVHVEITITAVSSNGIGYLGGVFGSFENSSANNVHYIGNIHTTHFVVGGFLGLSTNPIFTTIIEKASATANITSIGGEQSYAGGFVGFINNNMLTIRQSFADTSLVGSSYVGGFVGYFGSGRVENSYSKGSVTATNEFIVHAGGFIGRLEGYNSLITHSISMTSVTTTVSGQYIFKGAFVGHTVGGTFANVYNQNFYDSSISTLDRIGNPTTGRGNGITSRNLSTEPIVPGFDTNIWSFNQGKPRLKWQG